MSRHNISVAAQLICGDDSGLTDPRGWVMRQIRRGKFRACKIGRNWFMTDADIDAAKESLYAVARTEPQTPAAKPVSSVVDGLSAGARRRLRSAS